jgi:outer membrane protein assembly factor BamE (lipoprotein component of BamABCDE complex)
LDVNRIEVDFVNGKATRIVGRFSPVSPAANLNEEVLRKLKAGMTAQEVEKLVGSSPGEKVKHKETLLGDADRHVWHKQRFLSVTFEKGKVVRWDWEIGFNDKAK